MSWWLRLRRSDAPPTRGLEPGWPAGASARGLRGKPATSKTAAHRSLSAPCARPRRAARRVGRCTRRTAGRREDPPHRALERERKRTPPGGARRADRVRAEPVQCFRPLVRRCACRVREIGHRLPALAPIGGGGQRSRHPCARQGGAATRCYARPDRDRLAACPIAGHGADPWYFLAATSRRECRGRTAEAVKR